MDGAGVRVQMYDANGARVGGEILVSETSSVVVLTRNSPPTGITAASYSCAVMPPKSWSWLSLKALRFLQLTTKPPLANPVIAG